MQHVSAHHDVTWRLPCAAQTTSICACPSDFDYSTSLMFCPVNEMERKENKENNGLQTLAFLGLLLHEQVIYIVAMCADCRTRQ